MYTSGDQRKINFASKTEGKVVYVGMDCKVALCHLPSALPQKLLDIVHQQGSLCVCAGGG